MYQKSKRLPETVTRTYIEEELHAYNCRMKADAILFEAYPYLSVKGLTEEYWGIIEESKLANVSVEVRNYLKGTEEENASN